MKQEPLDPRLLKALRVSIDEIDSKILELIALRMSKVSAIGQLKLQNKIPIVQEGRWKELMVERQKLAQKHGLSPELTNELFELLAKHAIRIQNTIFENEVDDD